MSTPAHGPATGLDLAALDAITDAVESGAGLPEVVRAAARALDASLVLTDRAGAVLAVAARSPADERSMLDDAAGVDAIELRVADAPVGTLRMRARGEASAALVKIVTTLIASEVERLRAPERASEQALAAFLHALLERDVSGREDILGARGRAGHRPRRGRERRRRPRPFARADRGRLAPARARRRRPRRARRRDRRRRGARGARRRRRGRGRRRASRRRRRDGRARGRRARCASCRAPLPGHTFALGRSRPAPRPASTCIARAPRRCSRPTWPRATPTAPSSRSRSRAPTACC